MSKPSWKKLKRKLKRKSEEDGEFQDGEYYEGDDYDSTEDEYEVDHGLD